MARTDLYVIIEGKPAGLLSQDGVGHTSFRYFSDYKGIPMSLRMPVRERAYDTSDVRPYLQGLLPDGNDQKRAIGNEFDCVANDPVALLSRIGLDCAGAVQFCPAADGALRDVLMNRGEYVSLSDHEVALRLKSIKEDLPVSWMGENEGWTLGGMQGKFALAYHDGAWCSAQGCVPTTHIFKTGVQGFRLQALNEYVCMRLAAACGVDCADVGYRFFEDECALMVSRYDRVVSEGVVSRLHQEDLCQTLGFYPNRKYEEYGGPTISDVLGLLVGGGSHVAGNLWAFTKQLFFNYLIGAPDAHAKNYSIVWESEGSYGLAPLYDVASGMAYDGMREKMHLAMAIGGENRFGHVTVEALERYVSANDGKAASAMASAGIDCECACDLMRQLAHEIPQQLEMVLREAVPGMGELRDHLLGPVCQNCVRALNMLGVTS